ncbi:MAG: NYN domain-containing protein [Proteobacteria bacterium]|nr:NYN domain-containing protein [Burkholderiales bacterium]
MATQTEIINMAVFCDFENVALGVRDARYAKFDIDKVLERLLLKGSIVVRKAYCDWERYKEFKKSMHEASFELIEIPHVRMSGKNSADIRMVVDALDLCYTKAHLDTFVLLTGDSDFSPLVAKLRENAKTVIGVGVKQSTSDLLINICDEFIYYDDLVREQPPARRRAPRKAVKKAAAPKSVSSASAGLDSGAAGAGTMAGSDLDGEGAAGSADPFPVSEPTLSEPLPAVSSDEGYKASLELGDKAQQGIEMVLATVEALVAERGEEERIWGSMVKQTLKRRNPGFNESYYGFRSFSELLEEAQARRLLELTHDEKSGGFILRLIPHED